MTINSQLLEMIRARQQKLTSFNHGISTADRYVKTLEQCVGNELCSRYACAKTANWQEIVTKASETLTYSNEDMTSDKIVTSLTDWKKSLDLEELEIELPKNALVVFSHTLTTPRKDRDGDRLRSEGAELDPKMLLLWQHIPTLPIGKMLATIEHNKSRVRNVSCVVDMNELCHDAAVMIDNGMGRYSHGFRALMFEALKDESTEDGPNGFDIKRFEIMEESLVSVPSNVDADTEEHILCLVDGGKLTSEFMKKRGELIREKRPTSVNVTKQIDDSEENSNEDKPGSGSSEKETGCECKCEGGCSCTPAEGSEGDTKETTATGDTQVKSVNGPIEGSWEYTSQKLRQQAKSYMESSRVVGLRDRFVWIVGTFSDHVIVCCEGYESGVADEYLYYKVNWEMVEKEPTLKDAPVSVDIVTTTEITEKSPLFKGKNPSSDTEVEEKSRTLSVDQAIGTVISDASKEERAKLKSYLAAIDRLDESVELVSQYQTLFSD